MEVMARYLEYTVVSESKKRLAAMNPEPEKDECTATTHHLSVTTKNRRVHPGGAVFTCKLQANGVWHTHYPGTKVDRPIHAGYNNAKGNAWVKSLLDKAEEL